tara:strand:- start:4296 stop:7022 length:2727 start_codon:yes stop_codon:yes gene_type:complete
MANEISYFNTPYTFINPVRYFKANDPYYFEVDNIPVKQLEESNNFLKDQVDGLLNLKDNVPKVEIDRSGFTELKPYSTGSDRKVRVRPGKFTARINNAFDITPLQVVQQIGGYGNSTPTWTQDAYNTWEVETVNGPVVKASLDEFQNGLLGTAYMMNGLYERAFVYPVGDGDGIDLPSNPYKYLGNTGEDPITSPGYSPPAYGLHESGTWWSWAAYPNYTGIQPTYNIPEVMTSTSNTIVKWTAKNQGNTEANFIKRWRGAIRTSVVDVPEELNITIPDYDEDDFFYFDTNGDRQSISSQQRIDLLFIYTKAIDETATTLNKFNANGDPQRITRAELGIVKGAGVGLSRQIGANNDEPKSLVSLQSLGHVTTVDGTPLMFAHPGDHGPNAPDNVGFSTSAGIIKGSYPSPDDLMNLAPVLSENLETNTLPLIGQSILPIAYIRVQAPEQGGPIVDLITEEDIIDIRPFFRTTELAYNERAGIAAATPQISIANPVVSEAHLEEMRQEILTPIDSRLRVLEGNGGAGGGGGGGGGGTSTSCRTIAAGQVLGGFWGPEGALIRHAKENTAGGILNAPMNTFVDLIESDFNYPAGSIPYLPNWDKASWYRKGGFNDDNICDHINIGAPMLVEGAGPGGNVKYMPPWIGGFNNGFDTTIQNVRDQQGINRFGMYEWNESTGESALWANGGTLGGYSNAAIASLNRRNVQVNYVSKRINLDLSQTTWVSDYHVNVNLLHCIPLTSIDGMGTSGKIVGGGQFAGAWVQKFKDYFVVNVAWVGLKIPSGAEGLSQDASLYFPWNDRNNPEKFAGFSQPQMDLLAGGNWGEGEDPAGYSVNILQEERRTLFNNKVNKNISQGSSGFTEDTYFHAVTPLLYPSVEWEVIGVGGALITNSLGSNGKKMAQNDPTVTCI